MADEPVVEIVPPAPKGFWASMPAILQHVLNPDSRKVGFGYQVFGWATYGCFFAKGAAGASIISADTWLLCVSMSGFLIGGGTLADSFIDAKFGKKA